MQPLYVWVFFYDAQVCTTLFSQMTNYEYAYVGTVYEFILATGESLYSEANLHECPIFQIMCVCVCVCARTHVFLVAQSCPTFRNPMDCSWPGSSVCGISQASIVEWVAIFFSRGSSWLRDWTCVSCISCIGRQILHHWDTWDALSNDANNQISSQKNRGIDVFHLVLILSGNNHLLIKAHLWKISLWIDKYLHRHKPDLIHHCFGNINTLLGNY